MISKYIRLLTASAPTLPTTIEGDSLQDATVSLTFQPNPVEIERETAKVRQRFYQDQVAKWSAVERLAAIKRRQAEIVYEDAAASVVRLTRYGGD